MVDSTRKLVEKMIGKQEKRQNATKHKNCQNARKRAKCAKHVRGLKNGPGRPCRATFAAEKHGKWQYRGGIGFARFLTKTAKTARK